MKKTQAPKIIVLSIILVMQSVMLQAMKAIDGYIDDYLNVDSKEYKETDILLSTYNLSALCEHGEYFHAHKELVVKHVEECIKNIVADILDRVTAHNLPPLKDLIKEYAAQAGDHTYIALFITYYLALDRPIRKNFESLPYCKTLFEIAERIKNFTRSGNPRGTLVLFRIAGYSMPVNTRNDDFYFVTFRELLPKLLDILQPLIKENIKQPFFKYVKKLAKDIFDRKACQNFSSLIEFGTEYEKKGHGDCNYMAFFIMNWIASDEEPSATIFADFSNLPDPKTRFTIAQQIFNFKQTSDPNYILNFDIADFSLFNAQLEALLDILEPLIIKDIKGLDLSNNKLMHLPKSLGNLTSLTELYISENSLDFQNLEDFLALSKLTNLEDLDLSDNNLKVFPKVIFQLKNLKDLCIHDNPFKNIPNNPFKNIPTALKVKIYPGKSMVFSDEEEVAEQSSSCLIC